MNLHKNAPGDSVSLRTVTQFCVGPGIAHLDSVVKPLHIVPGTSEECMLWVPICEG